MPPLRPVGKGHHTQRRLGDQGNVLQLADGVYTLETDNLGKVNVAESEIVSIAAEPETVPSDTGEAGNASLKSQAQEIQTNLLSDPSIMAEIQNIMQDPEIRGVLSDPRLHAGDHEL